MRQEIVGLGAGLVGGDGVVEAVEAAGIARKAIRDEIELYAEELKSVGVMRAGTDPKRFAGRVTADVLGA